MSEATTAPAKPTESRYKLTKKQLEAYQQAKQEVMELTNLLQQSRSRLAVVADLLLDFHGIDLKARVTVDFDKGELVALPPGRAEGGNRSQAMT